jgi:hypothetical protein
MDQPRPSSSGKLSRSSASTRRRWNAQFIERHRSQKPVRQAVERHLGDRPRQKPRRETGVLAPRAVQRSHGLIAGLVKKEEIDEVAYLAPPEDRAELVDDDLLGRDRSAGPQPRRAGDPCALRSRAPGRAGMRGWYSSARIARSSPTDRSSSQRNQGRLSGVVRSVPRGLPFWLMVT